MDDTQRADNGSQLIHDNWASSGEVATEYKIEFSDSKMPPILDLQQAGLRRSPRIAAQQKKPWYKCNLIAKSFCFLTVATTLHWAPSFNSLHSSGQNLVYATVNSFHSANQNFDNTLNMLHPMALMAEKEDNESYTFREMLKQTDASDFTAGLALDEKLGVRRHFGY